MKFTPTKKWKKNFVVKISDGNKPVEQFENEYFATKESPQLTIQIGSGDTIFPINAAFIRLQMTKRQISHFYFRSSANSATRDYTNRQRNKAGDATRCNSEKSLF